MSLLCSVPSFAVDKSLIGSWLANAGNGSVRWDIRFGGACTWTKLGPAGSMSESGTLNASDGQWMKSSKSGSDSGTYAFVGADKFVTQSGKTGRTEWSRVTSEGTGAVGASASSKVASPAVASTAVTYTPMQGSASQYQVQDTNNNHVPVSGASSSKTGSSKLRLKQFFKSMAPVVGAAADIVAPGGSGQNYPSYPSNNDYRTSYYPSEMGGAGQNQNQNQNHTGFGLGRALSGVAGLSGAGGGGDVHDLLLNNFPLPPAGDEAERFGLPGLARLAGGGMRKREFRSVF